VGEERFDLPFAQVSRMLKIVEAQEAPDPVEVTLFGLVGVMFAAQRIADLIDERYTRLAHEISPCCTFGKKGLSYIRRQG
jgi:hypothetical protein